MPFAARRVTITMLLWAAATTSSAAQSIELQKLTASPPQRGEYFAARVSYSGSVVIAGAPAANFDFSTLTGGVAHIFRYQQGAFVPEQILTAADRQRAVSFGVSVAIDGDVAVVAGYENNACTDKPACIRGAAWVFRYDYVSRRWIEAQKLAPSNASTASLYDWQRLIGPYVSISGNVFILGIHFDGSQGPDTGSAFAFRFDGRRWNEEQKLLAPTPTADSWFGMEVAVSGDVAVIGAFLDSPALFMQPRVQHAGSAQVYRYDGRRWNFEQTLLAYHDGQPGDLFGASVAIDGDVIIVGATTAEAAAHDSGAAHMFRYNKTFGAWFQEQKLTASDGSEFAEFGRSVSISGGVALVGAFRDNELGVRSGSIYVFRYANQQWVQQEKLTAADQRAGDRFGRSVSLRGDIAVVCAYRKDDACPTDAECDSGAAYIIAIGKRQP
jgi:hypothetical protein